MQQDNRPQKSKPYKVILVGSQAVGKSSLLNRLIESKFDANYSTTIGVDFKTINVPISNKQIFLQIWDTAGQEKFKALTKTYFRGSQGCICVYDIADQETLKRAEEYIRQAFDYQIKPDCIYLIANKCDLASAGSDQEGRELANALDVNFLKVSAKTGEGIGELVGNLATKLDSYYGVKGEKDEQSQAQKRPRILINDNSNKKSCAC